MTKPTRTGRTRKKRHVSLAPIPLGGDHGTGTAAATMGTTLQPITDANGSNPNHMGQRRRVNVISTLTLTMRQQQAAEAIQEAYCRVQMLSSGGELKEQVDASPKPDATIAHQCDTNSQWVRVTKAIKPVNRAIIDHVICDNQPINSLTGYKQARQRLAQTLDAVADHLRY
ncbi:MAG: hypothetical protein ACPG4X_20340 [Pikeienuella sp.]